MQKPGSEASRADAATDFRTWITQQERAYRVGGPILTNNTPLCPAHARNLLGFTAKTKYSYSTEFAELAQTVLGLDERLRITEVLRGGSAALAGIREGDILLAVGIEPVPEGENAEKRAAALVTSELQGRSELDLTIMRGDERMTVEVPLAAACAMKFEIGHTDDINAVSDGARVMVTRGMMNFVQSDDELAYIIAREVARNALQPGLRTSEAETIDRLRTHRREEQPATDGRRTTLPFLGPNPGIEELALYMLVRAGYSPDPLPDFLRRLLSAPEIVRQGGSVSDWFDQLPAIDGIAREIKAKQEMGLPLMPNTQG